MTNSPFHDESKAKRAPNGKFLPGHKPPKSPGRPPGPNGIKARAAREASAQLERMLQKSAEVIEKALENEDTQVAMWVVDRVRPAKRSDFVRIDIVGNLDTIEDVVATGQNALQAAADGEISLTDAKACIELLKGHLGILGALQIVELRDQIARVEAGLKGSHDPDNFPMASLPQWGKAARAIDKG